MENEENVNEMEKKENDEAAETELTEIDKTKSETDLDQAEEAEKTVELESPETYTSDFYDFGKEGNFTLEVSHHVTSGDMLVSAILAVLIGVTLLSRLINRS